MNPTKDAAARPPRPTGGRRWVRLGIEALLVVAILVVSGLTIHRVACRGPVINTQPKFGQPDLHDERVSIPARPHDIQAYLREPQKVGRYVTFTYSTDSMGFRGEEVPRQKPAGGFRVAVVGECVAFGNGVQDDEPWPAVLEELLRVRLPGRTVEVINASSPDPPDRVFARLHKVVPDFAPDVVFLAPGADLVFQDQREQMRGPPAEQRYAANGAQYRAALAAAIQTCRTHGVQPVLVTPTFNSFIVPTPLAWVGWLTQVGREQGTSVLDTTALIRGREAREGLVFERTGQVQRLISQTSGRREVVLEIPYMGDQFVSPEIYTWLDDHPKVGPRYSLDENHPNPDGHRLIAEAALHLLESQQLLPGGP